MQLESSELKAYRTARHQKYRESACVSLESVGLHYLTWKGVLQTCRGCSSLFGRVPGRAAHSPRVVLLILLALPSLPSTEGG